MYRAAGAGKWLCGDYHFLPILYQPRLIETDICFGIPHILIGSEWEIQEIRFAIRQLEFEREHCASSEKD